jgi:prepilin-type N-terminal cleavage/methylation domain-containing protein
MSIRRTKKRTDEGFSLIEVLLGIALIGIAMLGLAQLFVMSVWNNRRADVISGATFLAQQEIDSIRTLTPEELASLPVISDETIDVNQDGTDDFRRLTTIDHNNFYYKVLVFGAEEISADQGALLADPAGNRVLARMSTIINR